MERGVRLLTDSKTKTILIGRHNTKVPLTGKQTYQTFIFSTFFKALLSFARGAFSQIIDEQKQNATATKTELILSNFLC